MPCTTILVGKKASYDGSTMIARNDDGHFDIKHLVLVPAAKQPRKYKSVNAHLEIELPDDPMDYTCTPNVEKDEGIWATTGINAANVAMTATETITSNPRVMGADPLVEYKKAKKRGEKDIPGGIGEEDLVTIVLPYIRSAREGVLRLGMLLEKYGTYEENGIAFSDKDEIWWLETIGGHHWIACRVADEECVIMPNQFGLDHFDFEDAFGEKKAYLCSEDLREFIRDNHLDLNQTDDFDPRYAFGSHSDSDHVYNTPRAWYMARYFLPNTYVWDGPDADFGPESDEIPFSLVPEKKVTVEDVKYLLSSHYQGTPYDPYSESNDQRKRKYRTIGINRTGTMSLCQIRGYLPEAIQAVQWVSFGPTTFDAFIPVYTNTRKIPDYLGNVTPEVSTGNFYWNSRLIAALADGHFGHTIVHVERYQAAMQNEAHRLLNGYDREMAEKNDFSGIDDANAAICKKAAEKTAEALKNVLQEASACMKDGYLRWDN